MTSTITKVAFDPLAPKNAFRAFLERAEDDGWIASYRWFEAESYGLLKQKLKGPCPESFSRTHKKGTDGLWWAVEVEGHDGTAVGIDLEILISRPILDQPSWISHRLNLPRNLNPQKILEEWSSREAAFKALAPDNKNVFMSQFKRTAPNTLTLYTATSDKSLQVRTNWAGKWLMTLAWRSLT